MFLCSPLHAHDHSEHESMSIVRLCAIFVMTSELRNALTFNTIVIFPLITPENFNEFLQLYYMIVD